MLRLLFEDYPRTESEAESFEISVGDVALIKAGEVHKHGALPGYTMTHISITAPGTTITQVED